MANAKASNIRRIRNGLRQNSAMQTKKATRKVKPKQKAKRKIGSIFCSICSKSGSNKSCCSNAVYHVVTQSKYIQKQYAVTTCNSFEEAQEKVHSLNVMAEATKAHMRIMRKKRMAQQRNQSDPSNFLSENAKRKATLHMHLPAPKKPRKQPENKENRQSLACMPGPLPPLPPLTVIGGGVAYPIQLAMPPHLPQVQSTCSTSVHASPHLPILGPSLSYPSPYFAGYTFQQEIDYSLFMKQ